MPRKRDSVLSEAGEMAPQKVHVVIFRDADSDQWVAICLEYDVTTQGDSEEHAEQMIKEAVELYLEDIDRDDSAVLYQAVEGVPCVHELFIDAPTLLHS